MARGINHYGSFSADAAQDIIDTDAFQGPLIILSGSADAIPTHVGGNFLITTAGVDAMTIGAPTAGTDDGLTISLQSTTAQVHTLTGPTGCFATGVGVVKHIATWTTGYIGQGVVLRAYGGIWYQIGNVGTITYS
jgi:hypothetical protein